MDSHYFLAFPPFVTPQYTTNCEAGKLVTNIVTFNEIGNDQSTNLKIHKKGKLSSMAFASSHCMFPQFIKTRVINEASKGAQNCGFSL